MKGVLTIILLIFSNLFMTLSWYGHLKFNELKYFQKLNLISIILISWGIALLRYCFQVPANKIGHQGNGGPFNIWQLKILHEFISLIIFSIFAIFVFKTESFRWNYIIGFLFLIIAIYFFFKK